LVLALGLSLISSFTGCHGRGDGPSPPKVTLRQEWFPNANYSGALFASRIFAPEHGIQLQVDAGSDQIDPVKLVITGQDTFGDASADKVLVADQQGADLVIIGAVSYVSPTVFITKRDSHIRTPKEFEGKRVGVLTGTNTEYVYRTLLAKSGVDKSKIKELEIPFDLTSFITTDQYDVRPAFIYDEPVSLDLKEIKYNLIEPRNFGVSFIGTVYFTKRSTIEDHPALVQSFVSSVAEGWRASLRHKSDAIHYLKEYDKDTDENRELLSLQKGESYFSGKNGKILWADLDDWQEMVKELQDLAILRRDFNVSHFIDNEFLIREYAANPGGTNDLQN
jgi:ABC-type nitrate/sulfonate/bicarbonate transport system substrate-binding protein